MFLVVSMLCSSAYAISPGMIVALLQGFESYASGTVTGVSDSNSRRSFYCGLQGVSYTVNNNNSATCLLKIDCWNPYDCKNIVIRMGITAFRGIIYSGLTDLLLGRRQWKDIRTLSYCVGAGLSAGCGSLLGIAHNRLNDDPKKN